MANNTSIYNTSYNASSLNDEKPAGLFMAYNVLFSLTAVVIMFSMGTSITIPDLKIILKRPTGPIIGLVCQCILMPVCCFGYAIILRLPDNIAIGMVVIGSCPGGSFSNILTYWTRADISLSVCMTAISTTLAIGSLPLNMFIYSRRWIEHSSKLPYANMVITILYMWAAVILGYLVGRKWPRGVPYFTKIGSVLSLALIAAAGFIQGLLYPELFDLPWTAWVGGITMPLFGFLIGYAAATLFCMALPQRLAIGFETGVQNTSVALAIMTMSFKSSYEASLYSQYILLYASFQFILGMTTVVSLWIHTCVKRRELPFSPKSLLNKMLKQQVEINEVIELPDTLAETAEEEKLSLSSGIGSDGEPRLVVGTSSHGIGRDNQPRLVDGRLTFNLQSRLIESQC